MTAASCLLVALVLAIYWPVFQFPFVNYDDPGYVTAQSRVQRGLSWENLRWAFTTLEFSNWHPLTWISLMADVSLFGVNPSAMHAVNVALHALNAVLLLWLLHNLTGAGAASALVAALFAAHPLRVESVAWISERKDLLSALFGLLAIVAYVAYVRRASKLAYAAALVLFACSMMSKPMLMTLPALLLLLDWWPLGRIGVANGESLARLAIEKLPLLAIALASAAIGYHAQAAYGSLDANEQFPFLARLLNALAAFAAYVRKTLLPADLAVFYPYSARPPLPLVIGGALLLGLGAYATLRLLRNHRDHGAAAVGLLWFLGTLIPVIGLVQIGQQAYADRYTYFPGIGLFIALAWGAAPLPGDARRLALPALGCVVLLPLAWQARRQVSHWQDSERLWRRAIEVTRDNYIAHASLGQHLIDVKRNAEAMAELQQAIRIRPQYPQPYGNIGLIHSASGRVKEAESAYLHALRLAPVNPVMHMNLGVLYAGTARPREAEAAYHEALRLAPESADVHYNLGLLYARAGRQQDALRAYRRATELAPHMVEVRGQLAILLTQLGRHAEAVEQNAQWLRLQPGSAIAHNNMANALVRLDRAREAIAHYQRASALDAKYVDPLINLGTAQLGLGDRAAARQAWEAALRMEPDNAIARQRLDKLAAETATGAARHR